MTAVFVIILLIGVCANSAIGVQNCTTPGKFIANYNCTSFITCLDLGIGGTEFPSYPVTCPPGFYVRAKDMVCFKADNVLHVCDPTYLCNVTGNFTNPSNTSASSYISCIRGIGTMIIATVLTCPDSRFNSTLGECEQIISTSTEAVLQIDSKVVPAVSVETTSISATSAAAVSSTATADATTESIANIFTTTTQKIGTHRANSAAHIYSSYIVILASVISVVFY